MRGMRVSHEHDRETQSCSAPGSGVYAELSGVAADHDLIGTPLCQEFAEVRAKKRVWRCLAQDSVSVSDDQTTLELPTLGAVLKKPSLAFVMDEDDRCPSASC